jgi:hypothetical protein
MDQINQGLQKLQNFLATPTGTYVVIGIIVVLIILLIVKSTEGFEGLVEGASSFAEYPKSFSEFILPSASDHIKDIKYENYFVQPTEQVMPNSAPMDQMELQPMDAPEQKIETPAKTIDIPNLKVEAPVDLGNGVVAMAKVSVPAQSTEVPAQTPIVMPPMESTNVKVEQQTIEIPAQEGVIPTKIEGSDASVTVPVTIPAQTVVIEEQNSVIPVVEPFRM